MARSARLSVAGEYHEVLLEGGGAVFQDEMDCVSFLSVLSSELQAVQTVLLFAWVLLPASVRLLVIPRDGKSLSALMQGVGRRWVPQYNARHGLAGSPWTGRYRSAPLDSDWALRAMRHVECQPVLLGISEKPWRYRWSSCAGRVFGIPRLLETMETGAWLELGNTPFDRQGRYQEFLEEAESEAWLQGLEASLKRGRAYGSEAWMIRACIPEGRRPTGRRPGRPKKSASARD